MNSDSLKQKAAHAALAYIEDGMVIGVGTGSTVNFFIQELVKIKHRIDACIASSQLTAQYLRAANIPVIELNAVSDLPIYIDGADEVNAAGVMIKGGGGALTREKIIAAVAREFICIVDETKFVRRIGNFPLAIEVLPIARSYVAREIVKLGGNPVYRQGFITDNSNIIIDVYNLDLVMPINLEEKIKLIQGVVDSGLCAKRVADRVLIASATDLKVLNISEPYG
jgi:ribose 5-phosphate isomerase A